MNLAHRLIFTHPSEGKERHRDAGRGGGSKAAVRSFKTFITNENDGLDFFLQNWKGGSRACALGMKVEAVTALRVRALHCLPD